MLFVSARQRELKDITKFRILGLQSDVKGNGVGVKSPSKANLSLRSDEETPSRSFPGVIVLIQRDVLRRI